LPGQPASRTLDLSTFHASNVGEARELASSQCKGEGLEIGAGSSPFPVPLNCRIKYGDMYSYDELLQNAYPGQPLHDVIAPDIKTNFDTLENIGRESLDFIVACHVIEHTRSPITSIKLAYEKLKPGGHLVLVVPDRNKTFDFRRPITPLQHFIDDYTSIHPDRDMEHYKEFFSLAEGFVPEPNEFETIWRKKWEEKYSIHFHTWDFASFGQMIGWIQESLHPYNICWAQETLPDGIEFYYVLEKPMDSA